MVTIAGVQMSEGAARSVEWTGVDVAADVARLRAGLTVAALLAECLEGVEDEQTADDWRDYVAALERAVVQ